MSATKTNSSMTAKNELELTGDRVVIKLPELTTELNELLKNKLPRACYRVITHLLNNNGCISQEINKSCSVANVSDVMAKSRIRLFLMGFRVSCVMTSIKNKFDVVVYVGSWWLELIDVKALNDELIKKELLNNEA